MNPPKLISPSFVFRHWPDLAVDVVFTFENAQEGFLLVHEILSDLLWTARSNMKRAIDALLSCQTQSEHRSCSRHQSNQFHPTELWVFARHRGTVSLPARPMCKGNRSPVSGKKNAPHTANYEEELVKRSLVMRNLVTIASPQGNL